MICTLLSLTGEVRQSRRMPDTTLRSPERVRGSLPDSSGARVPTNMRWVGTTPISTFDLFLRVMMLKGFEWLGWGEKKSTIH